MMDDSNSADLLPARSLRGRHYLYACVLFAASITAFGAGGFFVAVFLVNLWGRVYASERPWRSFARTLLLTWIFLAAWFVGMFAEPMGRSGARAATCKNNLKWLGLALHNYHDEWGSFPPAVNLDAEKRPMHSWRVLLLPFVDHAPLYDRYNVDEPWNSSHNAAIAETHIHWYACPSSDYDRGVNYVAIIGPQTLWPDNGARRLEEVTDERGSTLALIEVHSEEIPWMEPRDLSIGEAVALLESTTPDSCRHVIPGEFRERAYGRRILMADGSVHSLKRGVDRATALALLNVDDGGPADMDAFLEKHTGVVMRWRLERCIPLGLFLVLAVLPAQVLFRSEPRE